jgi:tRNA G18 (ribose-2'-O)-methylase SpoU
MESQSSTSPLEAEATSAHAVDGAAVAAVSAVSAVAALPPAVLPPSPPKAYLVVHSIVKRLNVGMMMRTCVAMGVSEMLAVGSTRSFGFFGTQGTDRHMHVRWFPKLGEAVGHLRERGVTICGIEITPDAAPVHTHPFRGPTAFIAGNEGEGLTAQQKAACDHFVYIPQHGNGTASLNVATATAIVLHHFAVWAGMPEQPREAGRDKFVVEPPPQFDGTLTVDQLALREMRKRRKDRAAAEAAAAAAAADGEGEEEEEGEEGDGEEGAADGEGEEEEEGEGDVL